MNFDFSDDQKFLKTEARKFLEGRCGVAVVRGVLDDPAISYDSGLWKAVGEQGWLGAAIPEADGGLGLGRIECVLLQQASLHQQVKRIGLAGQTLMDQRISLRVLGHAVDGGQTLKKVVEKKLFLGSHGVSIALHTYASTTRAREKYAHRV